MAYSRRMNWDDIRIFLAISREGSLSAAARTLRVTQPTVGRRLKALEEQFGARLFERMPDGLVPSPAGTELLPLAEAMEETALAVDLRKSSLAETASGTVRISVWESFAHLLTRYVPEVQDRLSDIEIEIQVNHIHSNLMRREADLIIQECMPDAPSLIVRRVGAYNHAVYGSRDYVSAHPEALGEARYQECQWVGFDEEHAYFHNQSWLLEMLDGRFPSIRTNDAQVIAKTVRQGGGLGVLPCFIGDESKSLIRLTPPIDDLRRPLHLVVHRDIRKSPAVRAVIDTLADIFKRDADRLLGTDPSKVRAAIADGLFPVVSVA